MSITQPPVFLCPSDFGIRSLAQGTGFAGVTNYVLNTGTTLPVSPKNPSGIPVTGVFFENSRVRLQDVTDGTSSTVCISEQVISDPNDAANSSGNWNGKTPTTGFVLTSGNIAVTNDGGRIDPCRHPFTATTLPSAFPSFMFDLVRKRPSSGHRINQVLLTTKEMVEDMATKGYWSSPGGKTPHATLYSTILRELQSKGETSRFIKTDRGHFKLRTA